MRTPEDILGQAADLMERDGWTQGSWGRENQPHCLHGAVTNTVDFSCEYNVYEQAWAAVGRETAPHHPLLFNDLICQSKEEAVAILRNAKRWL